LVHFYSTFWSLTRSNKVTAKCFPGRRGVARAPARLPAPATSAFEPPRAFPRLVPRGHARPKAASKSPLLLAPRAVRPGTPSRPVRSLPPCHSLLPTPACAPMDAAEGLVVADGLPGRPYKGVPPSCPGQAVVKPPPAPLLAAAASSRPGRLCTKPSLSPPSLASTKLTDVPATPTEPPPRRDFQPRRPPPPVVGVPLAGAASPPSN
jgi:hypothetical protein